MLIFYSPLLNLFNTNCRLTQEFQVRYFYYVKFQSGFGGTNAIPGAAPALKSPLHFDTFAVTPRAHGTLLRQMCYEISQIFMKCLFRGGVYQFLRSYLLQ